MTTLYSGLSLFHVIAGFVGLLTFWLPMFVTKGSKRHRSIGRVFARAMITAACTALLMSFWTVTQPQVTHPERAADNLQSLYLFNGIFLGYLGLLSLMTARNGLTTIARKRDHIKHRNPLDILIASLVLIAALLSLGFGLRFGLGALIGMSVVGIMLAPTTLHFYLKEQSDPKNYLYFHIMNMVGAGIAAHTAFLAFGANQLFPNLFTSVWVWVSPSIIGTAIITFYISKYKRLAKQRTDANSPATAGA